MGLEEKKWERKTRKTKQHLYLYKSWQFKDIWTAKEARNTNKNNFNSFSSVCLSLSTKGNRKASHSLYILLWNITLPHHVSFKCFLRYKISRLYTNNADPCSLKVMKYRGPHYSRAHCTNRHSAKWQQTLSPSYLRPERGTLLGETAPTASWKSW